MENFSKAPSPKTPRIFFDASTGNFELSGRSIPENSIEFYKSTMHWLDEYSKSPAEKTTLNVKLEYFNTSSSKCLVEILRKLESMKDQSNVSILWHYEEEDEDMLESGEDFKNLLKIPLTLIELEEE